MIRFVFVDKCFLIGNTFNEINKSIFKSAFNYIKSFIKKNPQIKILLIKKTVFL